MARRGKACQWLTCIATHTYNTFSNTLQYLVIHYSSCGLDAAHGKPCRAVQDLIALGRFFFQANCDADGGVCTQK